MEEQAEAPVMDVADNVETAPEAPEAEGQAVEQPAVPEGQAEAATDPEIPQGYDYTQMTQQEVHDYWRGIYGNRSQELSEERKIADQHRQLMANPAPVIQQYLTQNPYLLQQMGLQQVQPRPQSAFPNQPQYDEYGEPVQQQQFTMEQVQQIVQQNIQQALQQQVAPLQQAQYQNTMRNVQTELDTKLPGWQKYEQDIMNNLRSYPNMAHDIDKLIDISVPAPVKEARYLKKYNKKLTQKRDLAETAPANPSPRVETLDNSTAGDLRASWKKAMEEHGRDSNI